MIEPTISFFLELSDNPLMLNTLITDYFFLNSLNQLLLFALIIVVAGIVRGCIGFGFSAIVVASTSFWLPPVAVVNLVVLLEIAASVNMLPSVRHDVRRDLLIPLTVGALLTSFVGTWLLATLSATHLQWIIGIYMLAVALLTLSGYQFKGEATPFRLLVIGIVAGFFNGLAAIGGLSAAWGMVGSKLPVRDIRAVIAVFFLFVEVLFLLSAWWNDMMNMPIFATALVSLLPLTLGIKIGTMMFASYPEETLKKLVLIALMALSILGIYKTVF